MTATPSESDHRYTLLAPATAASLKLIRALFDTAMQDVGIVKTDPLVLALDEACSNLIKHRSERINDGVIQVEGTVSKSRVEFRIGGFCQQGDVPHIKPRNLDDIRPGGLGTHFIDDIMDEVRFEPDPESPGVMTLIIEKKLTDHD